MASIVENMNPFFHLANWMKRIVLGMVARDLAAEASAATGEPVEPLILDVESKPVKRLAGKKK